jgi:hypothetical protein
MNKNVEERLKELRTELENGQTMLAGLNEQRAATTASVLRISGAIQVLEELIAADAAALQQEQKSSSSERTMSGFAA